MSAASKLAAMAKAAHSAAPAPAPAPAPAASPKAAPKVAPVAAPKAAPPPPPPAANQCREFRESGTPCSRKNCRDAGCRKANASAPAAVSPKHSALAKSAGGGDGGVSAQISAMEARLTGHIDQRFQAAEESVRTGFLQQEQSFLGLHQAVAQSQVATQQSFQALAAVMATAISGGQRQLPLPDRRQIGNAPQEIAEPRQQNASYMHSCFATNEGESGRFAAPSSQQRPQSVDAYGGGGASADDSSRFLPCRETPTEFRGSSGGSTFVAARQLGVSNHLQNFEAAAERWDSKRNPNNGKILQTIRQTTSDDDMACLLLALVNGKTHSEIFKMYNSTVRALLTTHNTPFFQRFFTSLTRCGLPPTFDVKVDSSKTKSGSGFCMTYQLLSQAPGNVDKLVNILRGE